MINENEFIEYLDRCAIGKELTETKCIEDDCTHYFIMSNDMSATFRMLKFLAAYRYYYSEKTNNRITVNRIIAITTKYVLPIVQLCGEVDDVIVITNEELECMNDYASCDTLNFNTTLIREVITRKKLNK